MLFAPTFDLRVDVVEESFRENFVELNREQVAFRLASRDGKQFVAVHVLTDSNGRDDDVALLTRVLREETYLNTDLHVHNASFDC